MRILLPVVNILLLIHYSISIPQITFSPSSRNGLNGDTCLSDSDCVQPRVCILPSDRQNNAPCTPNRGSCICIPTTFKDIRCNPQFGDRDCTPGERCADSTLGNAVCISANLIDQDKAANVTGPEGEGFTGETCLSHLGCRAPRLCFVDKTGPREVCAEQGEGEVNRPEGCRCIPLRLSACERNDQCVDGEKCSRNVCTAQQISDFPPLLLQSLQQGKGNESVVVDSDGDIQNSISNGGVCIAVHHLRDAGIDELVFEEHKLAKVLCDHNGSCATPGHIVVWHALPMMMANYCESVGCTNKVVLVNSPRWRFGRRVQSHTDHLMFSALAARYETRAEEQVMKLAIRVGA